MTCKDILRLLLAGEHPERPSAAVRKHLSGCPSCRNWHRRLVRLERQIPLMPVPASEARERLLAQIRPEPTETVPLAEKTSALAAIRASAPLRVRYVVASAAGLVAAAVLFALIGWWVFPPGGSQPPQVKKDLPDPLLASLVQHNIRLANAKQPSERVEVLVKLANVLHDKTCELADAADENDLKELAALYEKVVTEGVVGRARALPPRERTKLLDAIITQLAKAEADAKQRADETTEPSKRPLLTIASAARRGHAELRNLLQEVMQ